MPSKWGIFIFWEVWEKCVALPTWQSRNFHLEKHPFFQVPKIRYPPLELTAFSPLENGLLERRSFRFKGPGLFSGAFAVSFRECIWVFPKIGVPQNVEHPIKMDDLGVPLVLETSI